MDPSLFLVAVLAALFLGFLFLGVPVGFALGGSAFATTALAVFINYAFDAYSGLTFLRFSIVVDRTFGLMKNEVLVALPMFILMGSILDHSGVAERLMQAQQRLFGRVPGGLAIGVTLMGILLAASTGIIGASVVLLGTLTLPTMMRERYSPRLAAGTVCSSGTLGILIPPSIMLILMSSQLDVSAGDLFLGAVFPGLLLSGLYILYIFGVALLNPAAAPKPEATEPLRTRDWLDLALAILPALFLMLIVLGSIFFGIATPTESSGMGALGATLLALLNKRLNLRTFSRSLFETLRTMGFLAAIFIGATCFSLVLRRLGGDHLIAEAIQGVGSGHYGTIFFVLLLIFALGFFLEWIEITMIMIPIVAPIVLNMDLAWVAESGMDAAAKPSLIWFAILCAVALQTSFLTPPVGFALFYVKGVAPKEITLKDIYCGVVPFIAIQLVALVLVLLFPALVTWLPTVSYAR